MNRFDAYFAFLEMLYIYIVEMFALMLPQCDTKAVMLSFAFSSLLKCRTIKGVSLVNALTSAGVQYNC